MGLAREIKKQGSGLRGQGSGGKEGRGEGGNPPQKRRTSRGSGVKVQGREEAQSWKLKARLGIGDR